MIWSYTQNLQNKLIIILSRKCCVPPYTQSTTSTTQKTLKQNRIAKLKKRLKWASGSVKLLLLLWREIVHILHPVLRLSALSLQMASQLSALTLSLTEEPYITRAQTALSVCRGEPASHHLLWRELSPPLKSKWQCLLYAFLRQIRDTIIEHLVVKLE